LFQLENSRTEHDIHEVLRNLLNWLNSAEQTSLRRSFTVWFNRVLLPRKLPDTDFTEFNSLQEVETMLAETVKSWKKEGIQEGLQQGRQEIFLLLVDSKFGSVSQDVQTKIRQASPEEIEKWTKQIFKAETPEALLNS
jgi:hypothetical protein